MFDLLNQVQGSVRVKITGAFPPALLNRCAGRVDLMSVEYVDAYTLWLRLPVRQLRILRECARHSQCTVTLGNPGGVAAAVRVLRRWLLPAALLILLLLTLLWSKAYIWKIEVSGNENVPTGKILDALSACGVDIGSFWPDLTSDSVRSLVLAKIPELSWLTVNIYGSRAEVIVRERIPKPALINPGDPADIYAERDGFITQVRALKGSAQVKTGQAVRRGELLVSGAVDSLPGTVRTVHAYGEVKAKTYYELCAMTPESSCRKSYTGEEKSRWALIIGDKRINIYGNSSIFDVDCDKIYTEYELPSESLFSLPIKLRRERCVFFTLQPELTDGLREIDRLTQTLHAALETSVQDGKILCENYDEAADRGGIFLWLRAECEEDIGQTVPMDDGTIEQIEERNKREEGKAQ